MIKIDSDREFSLVKESFSIIKKINLKKIGFTKISDSNLYSYQSDEYKILNYSINNYNWVWRSCLHPFEYYTFHKSNDLLGIRRIYREHTTSLIE